MSAHDSAEERTLKPTARKRRKARERGQVAQSGEVNHAIVMFGCTLALAMFGGYAFRLMLSGAIQRLSTMAQTPMTMEGAVSTLRAVVWSVTQAMLPFLLMIGVFGLVGSVVQTGIVIAPSQLAPNLSHIDPVKGLKNLFSFAAMIRFLVAVVKLCLITMVVYMLLKSRVSWFAAAIGNDAWGVLQAGSEICMSVLWRTLVVMAAVGAADFLIQKKRFEKQLMMTKTEFKEEMKREEGKPEVRARQAQMRRELARRRMMHAVPEADVVVTNPTEFAVALKWDENSMRAPSVVAKGRYLLAERIRAIAQEHGIPIVERKELAQALYKGVEVGMEIPPQLYYAVAKVLAFVMRKRHKVQ